MKASRLALCLALLLVGCKEARKVTAPASGELAPLTEAEKRGRILFHRGVSADGREMVGFIGEERVELSGSATACGRCHGRTGEGTIEGGIGAPSLRMAVLMRPGRYDEAALQHAIRTGVAYDGRQLAAVMPRFGLSDGDLADLLAYMRRLGNEPQIGVERDRLRIATALPLSGPGATAGRAVRAVLEARIAELNAAGGILRRRLELRVEDASRPGAAERLVKAEPLVVIAPAFAPPATELETLAREEIPVVGPLSPAPDLAPVSGTVFWIQPGMGLEVQVLVKHVTDAGHERILLVTGAGRQAERWAELVTEALERSERAPVARVVSAAGEVRRAVEAEKPQALLAYGSAAEMERISAEAEGLPVYATSAALASAARTPTLRVTHSGPVSGSELKSLARLASVTELPGAHRGIQHQALLALEVLEEALLRAGREVSRYRLLERLESLERLRTRDGFLISFGRNRRIGFNAARVVRASEKGELVPVTDWIDPAR